MNVDYKNLSSPNYKKLNFFAQSNGLTQHIRTTTRNTNKTNSLIDLAMSNSKFISKAGTLNHFISDHQPIYVIHNKGRDLRNSVEFKSRSYRNFDRDIFKTKLTELNWGEFYEITNPNDARDHILNRITPILDAMCPIRTFQIKNYRPDWMSNELIEQIKDRDYFYKRAKSEGDEDSWNIAKYLRNITNTNIRQAKRDFILNELKENENDCKKFWKIIREVLPSDKILDRRDIKLQDGDREIPKEQVAHFINDYFVNIGNVSDTGDGAEFDTDCNTTYAECSREAWSFTKLKEVDVYKVVKDINISKSSGIENVSSQRVFPRSIA